MTTPATMQWGCPQPRSGEGDEAMTRSGVNAQATHRPDPVATTAVTAVTRT